MKLDAHRDVVSPLNVRMSMPSNAAVDGKHTLKAVVDCERSNAKAQRHYSKNSNVCMPTLRTKGLFSAYG